MKLKKRKTLDLSFFDSFVPQIAHPYISEDHLKTLFNIMKSFEVPEKKTIPFITEVCLLLMPQVVHQ